MTFDLWGQRSRSHVKDSNFSGNNDLFRAKCYFFHSSSWRVMVFHTMVALYEVPIGSQKNFDWTPPGDTVNFSSWNPLIAKNNLSKIPTRKRHTWACETYTHIVRLNEYYKEKIWPFTSGVKGQGHSWKTVEFWKIDLFRARNASYPTAFFGRP